MGSFAIFRILVAFGSFSTGKKRNSLEILPSFHGESGSEVVLGGREEEEEELEVGEGILLHMNLGLTVHLHMRKAATFQSRPALVN